MNKYFFSILMLAAGLLPLCAESAPASLSVEQAVDAALRNNIGVKSVAVQERIKKRASDWSFNKFYPTVSTSATALRLNDPDYSSKAVPYSTGTTTGTPSETYLNSMGLYTYVYDYVPDAMNLQFTLTIQQIFSPAYFGLMDQAAIEYQRSQITRQKAENQMRSAVKKYFYQLLVQKEVIAVTQSRLDSANERLRQAQLAFDIGQGSELNLMYAKANVEGIMPELTSMKTSRSIAIVKFQELLGYDRRDDMELDGNLDDEKAAVPASLPGENRIDVTESGMTVKQLRSALRLTNLTLLPNLILQYAADPFINDPTADRLFEDSNWYQKTGGLSVTLLWNLTGFIPGSETQVKREELKDQLSLATLNDRVTRENAIHDEDNQKRLIGDSMGKIGNLQNVVLATKRTYEISDEAYKAGMGRLLDLQSAEIACQGAQIQLLNERLNLMGLVWELESKYY